MTAEKKTEAKKAEFKVDAVPQYKSHKQVRAAKVLGAAPSDPHNNTGFSLALEGIEAHYDVTFDWYVKHEVKVGGYVVFYNDGYVSFSPAEAFEEGYTLLKGKANG